MSDYAIGIDLGGTKIASILIDRQGRPVAQSRQPTFPKEGVEAVVARIAAGIREMEAAAPGPVAGVGVGIAGITDIRRGVVVQGVNLGWNEVPIVDLLITRLGTSWEGRFWVDKDSNAAALGELLYGAGRGARYLLYVTVGTGISAALILDGRLYHGVTGGDGNIGHMIMEPGGALCACGKRGCLETFVSGPAIARRAVAALKQEEASALSALVPETITAVEVVEKAQAGDRLACRVLAEAGHYLGISIAYCVDIINPERVVVGGGVMAAGELLLGTARQVLSEWALPSNAKVVQLVPAALGSASGAIGAAALVWVDHGD